MSILRALFGREVEVGKMYIFDDYKEKNPFKEEGLYLVEVIAVKDGFVNYKHLNTDMFQNESMTVRQFRFIYKAYQ